MYFGTWHIIISSTCLEVGRQTVTLRLASAIEEDIDTKQRNITNLTEITYAQWCLCD